MIHDFRAALSLDAFLIRQEYKYTIKTMLLIYATLVRLTNFTFNISN